MLNKEELLNLFDAYNQGMYSFAEIFLASGMTMKELIKFIKKNNIDINFNLGFLQEGRGLGEDVLKQMLEMDNNV